MRAVNLIPADQRQVITKFRALNHDGPATGTATDRVLVAAPEAAAAEAFAGPATRVGADIAASVHAAVRAGALAHRTHRTRRPRPQEAVA